MTSSPPTSLIVGDLTPLENPADPAVLRRLFGRFPSGVVAVCGLLGDRPVGLAASSFVSVSLEPPLVSVCAQLTSTTWPNLRRIPRLGISVLQASQADACTALSKKGSDRFAGLTWNADATGAVFVGGAVAWLRCTIEIEYPAGDHSIVLFRVEAYGSSDAPPLVFHSSRFKGLSG